MTDRSELPELTEMTAERFARLVSAWGEDGMITEGLRAAGVEQVLDRIFAEMAQRFRGSDGLDAAVQWLIDVRGEHHARVLCLRDGRCEVRRGEVDDPRVVIRTDLAAFARLVTGNASPAWLVLRRRLRLRGDLRFALRFPRLFAMSRS